MPNRSLDELCINTIRALSMDAVQQANSGHPGTPMGAAAAAYTLWTRFLKHNPANPAWPDRDRFVLSAGHASMLLYSLLHLTGYDLSLEEVKRFRQLGSLTPGHPEHGITPGVELTTGPLGAGFAMGVGLALAEHFLARQFNRPGHEVVDHYVYGLVSDGDLMEGVASEAASLAGTWRLGKLIYLYDDNEISIEGDTDLAFTEDVPARFQAYGWHVQRVHDANDIDEIAGAIERAREERGMPSLIVVPSTIAYGSPNLAGDAATHGAPLGAEEVRLTKEALGWPTDPLFYIPEAARAAFREALDRGRDGEADWQRRFEAYEHEYPDEAVVLRRALAGQLPPGWADALPTFAADGGMATRQASGRVLNALADVLPTLVGGSADLAPSTNTYLPGRGDLGRDEGAGRNIRFGVREHAMGNIVSGMALHGGTIPYGATFLTFSDYMRPALRLAALQQSHAVYVFTHDSIGLGEDGPTHQPIEHLASLRAMPGMTVFRPGDANETAACWRLAIERSGPAAIVLTRQSVPVLGEIDRVRAGVPRGAYLLAGDGDSDGDRAEPQLIVLATGSEVSLALQTRALLAERGVRADVVSMPSWEIFEEQPAEYRERLLPAAVPRLAVEAGSTFGWHRWVGEHGDVVGIDRFGASAPAADVFKAFGFTPEAVAARAEALLARWRAGKSRGT